MKFLSPDRRNVALLAIALIGLVSGIGLWVAGFMVLADYVWAGGVILVLAALIVEIIRSLRQGNFGLDIVAALSMSAALLFGETLAATVVALIYSGGILLEIIAEVQAGREMSDLFSHVPRTATIHRNGTPEDNSLDDAMPGDLLVIRLGDKPQSLLKVKLWNIPEF